MQTKASVNLKPLHLLLFFCSLSSSKFYRCRHVFVVFCDKKRGAAHQIHGLKFVFHIFMYIFLFFLHFRWKKKERKKKIMCRTINFGYCTFCDVFKELIWIVILGIIILVTIQPITDWRVMTTKGKCIVPLFNNYWIDLRSNETFVQ